MALKDVKRYYLQIQSQYEEGKELRDCMVQEFKSGNITKEQFDEFDLDLNNVKKEFDRLSYIMYLLNIPQRNKKAIKYNKSNTSLNDYFKSNKADKNSILLENKEVLANLRKAIKKGE